MSLEMRFARTISIFKILIWFDEIVNQVQPHSISLFVVVESEASVVIRVVELFGYIIWIL